MTQANRIEGIFRLTSPLHCASPDKSLVKTKGETPIVVQRVVTSTGMDLVPYFPGNDLRGRLRRKAAKIVLDHVCATQKVSAQLYAGLNSGAISTQPEADLTVEEAVRAQRNVYMGLFGGGARLLRSRFSAGDMVPVLQSTIDMGWVPAKFGEADGQNFIPQLGAKPLDGRELIQTTHVLRVDDTSRVLRPVEIERFIENAAEVVAEIQKANLASRNARKESKEQAAVGDIKKSDITKKLDIDNMTTFQSIIAGTPMYFRLDFMDDVTDAHVGLALMSLRDLVVEQRLGGWCRAGLGRFDASLTLTRHGESMPMFTAPRASDAATLSDTVSQFVEAANAEIEQLTEPALMAFFAPRQSDEEKSAKEEEKNAKAKAKAKGGA